MMVSLSNIAGMVGFGQRNAVRNLAKVETKLKAARESVDRLEQERANIVSALREDIQFEQILPDAKSKAFHEQLLENERVHRLEDVSELVEKRIGGEGANKRCFARVVSNGTPIVTTGIFTAMLKVPSNNGATYYSQIEGDIDKVKEMPIQDFVPPENGKETVVAVLYTISSSTEHIWEKGGRPLASSIYSFLHAEASEKGYNLIVSTLSPVRDFTKWLCEQENFSYLFDEDQAPTKALQGFLRDDDNRKLIKSKLMEYLLTEKDPVLNFHLGNGACIGDFKFNPDNAQDWAMVNYVYPSDISILEDNQKIYCDSKMRPIAPHLQESIRGKTELLQKVTCMLYKQETPAAAIPHFDSAQHTL